jgi:quinohemoprotein ethanol dehydrogenase
MAAPVTYTVDGVQYVTVAAGWGSGFSLSAGPAAVKAGVRGAGRVLTFALGKSEPVPPGPPPLGPLPPPTFQVEASAADIDSGKNLYVRECMACHGPAAIGGGSIADLRYSTAKTHEVFNDIVLGGIRLDRGMPPFADRLSPDQARQLQAYILNVAAEAAGGSAAP